MHCMPACRARVRRAITLSLARSPRYGSGSFRTASSSNRIATTWMKAIVVRFYFAQRWSGYEMRLLAAKSSAFMSTPRIGLLAVMPIKYS